VTASPPLTPPAAAPAAPQPGRPALSPLMGLAPFLWPYRTHILVAGLALLTAAGATLAVPAAVRQVIDLGFSKENQASISTYFMLLLGVCALLGVATAVRFYFVSWIGERVVADIRKAVFTHVIGIEPAFFETTRTAEVLSRLTSDTTLIETVVGSSVSIALRSFVTFVGGSVLLVVTSPKLAAIAALVVPLVVLPLVAFGRRVRTLSRSSQDAVADATAMAGEALDAIQVVQAFTHEDEDRAKFTGRVETVFGAAKRRILARALLTALVIFEVFAAIVVILWIGAIAVINDTMTAGTLSQFILYAVLVSGSVGSLSEVWGDLQRAAGGTERLMELLHAVPQITAPANPVALPPPKGALTFDHVTFFYPSRPQRPALDGISFAVQPGDKIALVGPSGAGKSTVFQLALRFFEPGAGRILIDGIDLKDADPRAIRARMAIVPQDTVVFADDVMANIRYGRPEASDAEVMAAADAAQCTEFVSKLPEGFHTFLGEKGVRLSGGQRQRIAIARAILRDPSILLLDEATSALDTESERLVQSAIERLARGRTSLVIAHRLSTVLDADRILVFDGVQIVAQGTHEELVRGGGLYARLAAMQFAEPEAAQ